MLCYYYPPLTDVGSKRSVAFSKYFQRNGWEPIVLSIKNPDKAYCSIGIDEPPEGIKTEYSYSILNLFWLVNNSYAVMKKLLSLLGISLKRNYIYDLFRIPDHFIGWIPHACFKGSRLIKDMGIDVIYVSCTPHSAAITGVLLKKMYDLPLVIDYRDPYYIDMNKEPVMRDRIDRSIQSRFLDKADIVIVNNEGTKESYIEEFPMVRKKIHAVHNGFDAEFMPGDKLDKFNKFTVIYTGDFYFGLIYPDLIFNAIAHLYKSGAVSSDNFQFLFYGDGAYEVKRLAQKYGIEKLVNVNRRVSYKKVLNELKRSHLQLLRILKPMISTKLFEGIPLNVPFLATIPSGEAEEIIREYSPSSYVVSDSDYRQAAEAIEDAMNKYRYSKIENNDVEGFLQSFSRERLAMKLMEIIEDEVHVNESVSDGD